MKFKTIRRILVIGSLLTLVGYLAFVNHASLLTLVHTKKLSASIIDGSIDLGKQYMLRNQRDDGSFYYEYDFKTDQFNLRNSQVRQAGALWGLVLCYQHDPDLETKAAIQEGIEFFKTNSKASDDGQYVVFPGQTKGRTGTMALVTLSLIDFMRVEPELSVNAGYDSLLTDYLSFILSLRRDDARFESGYRYSNGKGSGGPSPYFDGEILLTLCKAARYLGKDQLKPLILASADSMYHHHVILAREEITDSPITKGFFQWGSMSFYEIYTAGWNTSYAEKTIELAHWMIDTHYTLIRRKNTAYAHEGLSVAWELARLTDDSWSQRKIGATIDIAMNKLISWQVGGPQPNRFLRHNPPISAIAVGGVMNSKNDPNLRIDVTQHQMHALILARRFIYTN